MLTRQEAARRQTAAKKKYEAERQTRKKRERRALKRTATARALVPEITLPEILEAGLSVTTKKHGTLWYLDKNGRLHREDLRSAEQLIEQQEGKTP